MATKKQRRRHKVRAARAALKKSTIKGITGGRLYKYRYGDGVSRGELESPRDTDPRAGAPGGGWVNPR